MNIELLVVNYQADSVLRVNTGPALVSEDEIEVFLIKSGIAQRRKITTGMKGKDYIEILSGLQEGDKIIISDISVPRNIDEIDIQ